MGWLRDLWNGGGGANREALARVTKQAPIPLEGRTAVNYFLQEVSAEEGKSITPGDMIPGGWAGVPRWSTWSVGNAIENGFAGSTWCYVCAQKNAQAIAQLPWCVDRWDRSGKWIEVDDHPLETLLNRPNQFWSRQSFFTRLILELLIAGNSLVSKIRVGKVPVELWTVRPNSVAYVPSATDYISHYVARGIDGKEYKILAEDVVHISLPDPGNQYWGMSPMKAASKIIDVERDAAVWQKVSMQNLMVPPGMFMVSGIIDQNQFNAAKAKILEEYQGAINARRPLVQGNAGREAKWVPLSMTPVELDFIESRKLTREEICAIFGVPPPIVGIFDNSTYNNISTAKEIWWEETLIPLLAFVTESFNQGLTPEFGQDIRVRPDTSKVLALLGQIERKIGNVSKLWAMGVSFNDAAEFLNLGLTVPGGDVGYVASNLIPVGAVQTETTQAEDVEALNPPALEAPAEKRNGGVGNHAALLFDAFTLQLKARANGHGEA